MGYYPCPAEAVDMACERLRAPGGPIAICDPCAGEGLAIDRVAFHLGCPAERVYAVELEAGRSEELRFNLPGANVLAPASGFGCYASPGSFSLLWCNPPYDDGYDGLRVEAAWVKHFLPWLSPGGVLALCCPENVVSRTYSDVRTHLEEWYHSITVLPYPDGHRDYDEVVMLAVKRDRPYNRPPTAAEPWASSRADWNEIQAPAGMVYTLPSSPGPKRFEKREPTEAELALALGSSPLRSLWKQAPPYTPPSPPLALGAGHVALMLAAGYLDGVVAPDGEMPHLVRGTSRKKTYMSSIEVGENDAGEEITKTVYSEKIELVVRVVDLSGSVSTFTDGSADAVTVDGPDGESKEEDNGD